MEINRIMGDVKAVVATADVVEGRMVLLTSHSNSYDFGSRSDLPGVKVPATADEAKRARFIVTFPITYQEPPFYVPTPSMTYALRGGWDQAENTDFTAEVQTTYPGYKNSKTIPSGTPARAFGQGTFTVPSGQYIANAGLVPGAAVSVSYSGVNAGKLQLEATFDQSVVVGLVERLDSATQNLTVTLMEF